MIVGKPTKLVNDELVKNPLYNSNKRIEDEDVKKTKKKLNDNST